MTNYYTDKKSKLRFIKATKEYKDMIITWFKKEHVRKFYHGEGLKNTLHNLDLYCQGINNNGSYSFDHWVAFDNETPIGFLMTSPITGPYNPTDDYNKWYVEGKETFTLDLLIGETAFLGKGLAHRLIQTFILEQFANADYFIIDPEESNSKAIHVYEKAGFKKLHTFHPAYDPEKPHLMMRLAVENLKTTL